MDNLNNKKKSDVGAAGYIALIIAVVFFSGTLAAKTEWWSFLDFTKLSGAFGTMLNPEKNNFQGAGGTGVRHGFIFGLSLVPSIMFALGFMEVIDHYGGLKAGQKLFTPILRPLMGVPGSTSLALITSFQSMDASAAMLKELVEEKVITPNERTIMASFAFTGGGTITNYYAIIVGLFPFYTVPIYIPLLVVFAFKIFGANVMRFYLKLEGNKEVKA